MMKLVTWRMKSQIVSEAGGNMSTTDILALAVQNQGWTVLVVLILNVLLFLFASLVIARGLVYLASRSATKVDDILVRHVHPRRVAWLAPLIGLYACAPLFPAGQVLIEKAALFVIMWLVAFALSSLLDAINEIYEKSKNFNGVSIQGYFDIAKILIIVVSIILSITLITDESPWVLLTGLGALTAVLLLIFQNTILSLVASVQIVANDLLKEGDIVDVPSYNADGEVTNIGLHSIKIRNSDMTYTVIPTYKIVDVAYKNWRGMRESGGRRIQRSMSVDIISIKFCDTELLKRLSKIDLIEDYMREKIKAIKDYQREHKDHYDSPLDGPQVTNIEVFRTYITDYLKNRPDVYTDDKPFIVRMLAPNSTGLPIEIYLFVKTTQWAKYESIQAEIFDHLLAASSYFELRIFQDPTGLDFSTFAQGVSRANVN
jgi:miniconductance mechanosensitive channel